jgi:DUF971 family protein
MAEISPTSTPVRVKRLGDENGRGIALEIEWSSGETLQLPAKSIRERCPCATCSEKRGSQTHANPLGSPRTGRSLLQVVESTVDEALDLKSLWSVGNYALGIRWGDGHDSGIYSHGVLRDICKIANVGIDSLRGSEGNGPDWA